LTAENELIVVRRPNRIALIAGVMQPPRYS
jgi:hypothetical protein